MSIKILLAVFLTALILNGIWEFAQSPFYVPHDMMHCVWAMFWDAGYVIVLYFLLALINRDWFWIKNLDLKNSFIVITVSLFVAIGVELNAMNLGKWNYSSLMPLVPWFRVGLSPLIQLPLLSWLSFRLQKTGLY